jgi:hypothetical protein
MRDGNLEVHDNARKVKDVILRQIELIQIAKENNLPIVIIEYKARQISEGTEKALMDQLIGYENYKVFQKTTDSMFGTYYTEELLLDYLQVINVKQLVFAGANGNGCVYRSIQGAIRCKFNVIADANAIADFNSKERPETLDFIHPYKYDDTAKFYKLSEFKQYSQKKRVNDILKKNKQLTNHCSHYFRQIDYLLNFQEHFTKAPKQLSP